MFKVEQLIPFCFRISLFFELASECYPENHLMVAVVVF